LVACITHVSSHRRFFTVGNTRKKLHSVDGNCYSHYLTHSRKWSREPPTVLGGGKCYAELLRLDEPELCTRLRADELNFYPAAGCQPFVPLAANGPWIITTHGAVIYDTAGYGQGWPLAALLTTATTDIFSIFFIS
jgi:hypothetical protein